MLQLLDHAVTEYRRSHWKRIPFLLYFRGSKQPYYRNNAIADHGRVVLS